MVLPSILSMETPHQFSSTHPRVQETPQRDTGRALCPGAWAGVGSGDRDTSQWTTVALGAGPPQATSLQPVKDTPPPLGPEGVHTQDSTGASFSRSVHLDPVSSRTVDDTHIHSGYPAFPGAPPWSAWGLLGVVAPGTRGSLESDLVTPSAPV